MPAKNVHPDDPEQEHEDKVCPECGSEMTWYGYPTPVEWWGGGTGYGRYVCHNYGGCEYAPG